MAAINITYDNLDLSSYTFCTPNGVGNYDMFQVTSVPSLVSGYSWYLQINHNGVWKAQNDLTFSRSGSTIIITAPNGTFTSGTYGLLQKNSNGVVNSSLSISFTLTSKAKSTITASELSSGWYFILAGSSSNQKVLTISGSVTIEEISSNSLLSYTSTSITLLANKYGSANPTIELSNSSVFTAHFYSVQQTQSLVYIHFYTVNSFSDLFTLSEWCYGTATYEARYSSGSYTIPSLTSSSKPPPSHLNSYGFEFVKWAEYSTANVFSRYILPGSTYSDIGGDDKKYIAVYKIHGSYIYTSSGWKIAIPYIYSGGWKRAEPYLYQSGWKTTGKFFDPIPPKITYQPTSKNVQQGSYATSSVTATTQNDNLSYKWQYRKTSSSSWSTSYTSDSNFTWAQTATRTVKCTPSTAATTKPAVGTTRQARCLITDENGNRTISNTITFTVTSSSGGVSS